jgi:hypothetical protein
MEFIIFLYPIKVVMCVAENIKDGVLCMMQDVVYCLIVVVEIAYLKVLPSWSEIISTSNVKTNCVGLFYIGK